MGSWKKRLEKETGMGKKERETKAFSKPLVKAARKIKWESKMRIEE